MARSNSFSAFTRSQRMRGDLRPRRVIDNAESDETCVRFHAVPPMCWCPSAQLGLRRPRTENSGGGRAFILTIKHTSTYTQTQRLRLPSAYSARKRFKVQNEEGIRKARALSSSDLASLASYNQHRKLAMKRSLQKQIV